jgi:threonine dehydrogenase-like Zn-dependent dehydrogenase
VRAAVLRDGQIEVRETADPVPGPGQVLARTRVCAICASDVHAIEHGALLASDPSGCFDFDVSRDLVLGHEYCAEIAGYGPATERRIPVGARIASTPVVMTASGPRAVGLCNAFPGGFGELMLLQESLLHPVSDALPDEVVALVEPLSTGSFYVRRAALSPDDVPLVIGCGAIGMAVIASLRRTGARPIVAADFSPLRRELAARMGADVVIDPAKTSPWKAWEEVARSPDADHAPLFGPPTRPAVVFECVGVPGVLDGIVRGCAPGARILVAGWTLQPDSFLPLYAHSKGLSIQFGGGPAPQDFAAALDDVTAGRIDLAPLVSGIVPLDQAVGAIEQARLGRSVMRLVLDLRS